MYRRIFHLCLSPAVALSQEAKEEGAAIVDPLQTDFEGSLAGSIRFGNAPTQIDIDQPQFPLLAPLPQIGKNTLDQVIPLSMHVVEGATNKYVDLFPLGSHG